MNPRHTVLFQVGTAFIGAGQLPVDKLAAGVIDQAERELTGFGIFMCTRVPGGVPGGW